MNRKQEAKKDDLASEALDHTLKVLGVAAVIAILGAIVFVSITVFAAPRSSVGSTTVLPTMSERNRPIVLPGLEIDPSVDSTNVSYVRTGHPVRLKSVGSQAVISYDGKIAKAILNSQTYILSRETTTALDTVGVRIISTFPQGVYLGKQPY